MTTIEIEVSDESIAREVAYGIIGRAQQIHENPDDEFEDTAIELKNIGNDLREKYE
jgi:hypothetical protein